MLVTFCPLISLFLCAIKHRMFPWNIIIVLVSLNSSINDESISKYLTHDFLSLSLSLILSLLRSLSLSLSIYLSLSLALTLFLSLSLSHNPVGFPSIVILSLNIQIQPSVAFLRNKTNSISNNVISLLVFSISIIIIPSR